MRESVLIGGNRLHAKFGRQRQRDFLRAPRLLFAAGEVRRAGDRHAVFVAQDAANPNRRGHLIFGAADALADQILRLANSAVRVDVDAGMPEHARGKDRDRDERRVFAEERERVRRQRHLRHVELAMPQHAKEGFFHRQVQIVQIDAVDGDAAFEQRARSIVIPAGQRELEFRHGVNRGLFVIRRATSSAWRWRR